MDKFEQMLKLKFLNKKMVNNGKHLFRVIVTFRGPLPNDFRSLNDLLKNSKHTIEQQHLYLAYPDTELLFSSSVPSINSAALDVLSRTALTQKTVEELKKLT